MFAYQVTGSMGNFEGDGYVYYLDHDDGFTNINVCKKLSDFPL